MVVRGVGGRCFRTSFGTLSGPGALLLPAFLRHCMNVCGLAKMGERLFMGEGCGYSMLMESKACALGDEGGFHGGGVPGWAPDGLPHAF